MPYFLVNEYLLSFCSAPRCCLVVRHHAAVLSFGTTLLSFVARHHAAVLLLGTTLLSCCSAPRCCPVARRPAGERVIDVGSEWRIFHNDDGSSKDKSRVGVSEVSRRCSNFEDRLDRGESQSRISRPEIVRITIVRVSSGRR